jgi:hypothetical protein
VQTRCLASIRSRAFKHYTETAMTGWTSGFTVLTFEDGELLPPDLVTVTNESAIPKEGCVSSVAGSCAFAADHEHVNIIAERASRSQTAANW